MLAPYVWVYRLPLDLDLLNQAAAHVLGTHDFTSFAASDPDLSTRTEQNSATASNSAIALTANTRTIFHSTWHRQADLLIYRITGSGFLHHMVRNLVGTFVEAGIRRISPDDISIILAARDRSAAGPTAPATGLFLVNVEYE
jgi:tRNA pseudouridine38-40 synthase